MFIQTDYEGLMQIFNEGKENPSLLHKRIERYNDMLAPLQRHYLAMEDKKIIAMAASLLERDKNGMPELSLWHVSVDCTYRGQGYARQLLRMVFADAHRIGASVKNNGFSSENNREHLGACMKKIHAGYPGMRFILQAY